MENQAIILALENGRKDIALFVNIIDKLQKENEVLREKSETWERVTTSNTALEMSAVAKELNYKNMGRNKLFELLKKLKVLRLNNEPYQQHIDSGYFRVIAQKVETRGGVLIKNKTLVLPKGIDYMRKIIDAYVKG